MTAEIVTYIYLQYRRKSRIGKEGNREKMGKGIRGQEQGGKSKEMSVLVQKNRVEELNGRINL